jgi:hypothetical protein
MDDDSLKIEMRMSKYKNNLQLLHCISQRLVGEINNFTVYLKCVNKTFSKFQTFIWHISYTDQSETRANSIMQALITWGKKMCLMGRMMGPHDFTILTQEYYLCSVTLKEFHCP